jgi:hypothetical protein
MAKRALLCVLLAAFCLFVSAPTQAQVTTAGRLVGVVTDQTGAVIVGADVKVRDEATGAVIETQSGADGSFAVSNLKPGNYVVTVTMAGFKAAEFRNVKIIVGQIYDLSAKMEVGAVESTVVVEAGAVVLETASPVIGTTVTGKSITQLPFTSRDALDLAILMPGAQTVGRARATSFMGLPKGALNITIDGINAQDNLLKSSDGFFTIIRPRIDSMEEFSISTAGAGGETSEGAVQIRFETKRGGNSYTGGVWWQHRNDFLNSNYYFNNQAGIGRQRQRLNQYGYKIGGPILRERLFFFTAFDFYRNPESRNITRTILSAEAAAGAFRYTAKCLSTSTAVCTSTSGTSFTTTAAAPLPAWMDCGPGMGPGFVGSVPVGTSCLSSLIGSANSFAVQNAAMAGAGAPNVFDTVIGGWIAAIQTVTSVPGVGVLAPPSLFQQSVTFNSAGSGKRNFPDFRFDWNITKSHQFTAIYHYNWFSSKPDFLNGRSMTYPVAPFNTNEGDQISNRNQFTGAWRWNLAANKSNEVRFGVQTAPVSFFPAESLATYPTFTTNLGTLRVRPGIGFVSNPFLTWNQQGRNTAVAQLIETFSWSRGKHNMQFGFNFTRLILKGFFNFTQAGTVNVGMSTLDPLNAPFTSGSTTAPGTIPGSNSTDLGNARGLYALLAGRITSFGTNVAVDLQSRQFVTGAPRRDKVEQNEFGFYGQDSWRIRPDLTLTASLRWEFQLSPIDPTNTTFRLRGGEDAVFGVSGAGNFFRPGTLTGSIPVYELANKESWYDVDYNNLAPQVGLNWQPGFDNPVWNTLFGGPGKTVFRIGAAVNYTREGLNNFNSIALSNPGRAGVQSAAASTTAGPGTFVAGSLQFQNLTINNATNDAVVQTPSAFVDSFTIRAFTGQSVNVFTNKTRTPLVYNWNVGIQRELTPNMVVEVRYVGNKGSGLWRQSQINEVNIFENGFLTEFGIAKNNLAICRATAGCTARFSNQGLPGQADVPILTQAFTGSATGSQTNAQFSSGANISFLDNNTPGAFANTLALTSTFACNLLGTSALPGTTVCPTTAPVTSAIPVNFWIVNPHATSGSWIFNNDTHSSYHSLQIEFRRRMARGVQLTANYVWSHSLSNYFADSSASASTFNTLRDKNRDRGPSPFDLRHAFKAYGIWELPFGPGRKWSNSRAWINRIIEEWEVSTIIRWQTGRTTQWTSGLGGTFNQNDPGVVLNGITVSQIQNSLSVRKLPNGNVYWVPASLLDGAQQLSNTNFIRPCGLNTPSEAGTLCQRVFVTGPSFFRTDLNIVKRFRITERVRLEYRAEFLNAFNNINFFYQGSAAATVSAVSTRASTFGRIQDAYQDQSTTDDPGGRIIQMVLRVNF